MPQNPNTSAARDTSPESCGSSTEHHFAAIVLATAQAGLGFRCPEVYKALVEFTEGFRRAANHEVHTPTEDGLGALLAAGLQNPQSPEGQEFDRRIRAALGFPEAPARPAYDDLTPEEKRRLN